MRLGTQRFRRFLVENAPWKMIKDMKEIVDTLHNTSVEIFESKKHVLQEGNEGVADQIGRGKDIISILSIHTFPSSIQGLTKISPVKANMEAADEDKLSDAELLGQIK